MNAQAPLPVYAPEKLAELDLEGLLDLLSRNEDRVPRALIDECARRGEAMVARLAKFVEPDEFWSDDAPDGQWWLRLHAAMILGLISSEPAGSLLVALMRRIEQARDENLQDWLSGHWPALFRNKPDAVEPPLRELAQDRGMYWYMRIQALESLVTLGERRGVEALDAALDWAASIAADESEDWDLRLSAANTLLDFPRGRHRALLENLAARQSGWGVHFSVEDVRRAFSGGNPTPPWRDPFDRPWNFYAPEAIASRQKRWAGEAAEDIAGETLKDAPAPYVRAAPKISRNDPCPCGSGKKYKKCCLVKKNL
jgi:HEAT repeat protein